MNFLSGIFRTTCLKGQRKRNKRGKPRFVLPRLEALEDRTLLADPNWVFMGPLPQSDPSILEPVVPQQEGINQNYSGRVAALAVSNNYYGGNPALYAGTASGGIWRTVLVPGNNVNYSPNWQALDNIVGNNLPPGLNNIGAIVIDPTNPQRVYAGTGEAGGVYGLLIRFAEPRERRLW